MSSKDLTPSLKSLDDRRIDELADHLLETQVKKEDKEMDATMAKLAEAVDKKWSPKPESSDADIGPKEPSGQKGKAWHPQRDPLKVERYKSWDSML